jgi:Pseudouridylate synthases, 23S RNA-specific
VNTDKLTILHAPTADDPFAVLYKPHGIPSAPLVSSEAGDALSAAVTIIPGLSVVHGKKEIEYGLLHRLDTDACGLLLVASTQQSYDALSASQQNGSFEKTYRVVCMYDPANPLQLGGFPPPPEASVVQSAVITARSAFRPYGEGRRQVRPVTAASGTAAERKGGTVLYRTEIEIVDMQDAVVKAYCRITAGYRHQVRCHLAWLGIPVDGDRLYNVHCLTGAVLQFEGCGLSFPHPLTGAPVCFNV